MARVAGVNIPDNKHVVISLTHIYGIGRNLAKRVCLSSNIETATKVKDLTEAELDAIRSELSVNYQIEGDLRREVQMNRKRLMDLGCYRGIRHRRGLPLRGQRTRTNARTRKGRRGKV